MVVLYEIAKRMLTPPSIVLLLLLAGFVLTLWRFQRLGRIMLAFGIILFYLLSISPTADLLLNPLESAHAVLSPEMVPRIGTLIVLSGGASATTDLPTSSRLSHGSISRLLEAVRLYHIMDKPTIVISGGSGNPFVKVSEAVVMRELLLDLGIPSKRIIIEGKSRSTYENGRAIQQLRLSGPLILITSASHMTRSLRVFRALEMRPLPAPSDFRARWSLRDPLRFFPSIGAFGTSTAAIYEYAGIWWYTLMGRF